MTSGNYGPPEESGTPPQGSQPASEQPPPSGQPSSGQPPAYGQQPAYGEQPTQMPPGYGQQPPPGYGQQPPPGYGQQQPPAYGQQPGGAQPPGGFGQYQYGQEQGGYAPGAPAPYQMGTVESRPGITGLVLTGIGAAACIVAFTVTNWFKLRGKTGDFSKVHDLVDSLHRGGFDSGLSYLYFSWLAWVVLGVAAVAAIVGNLPSPASVVGRVIGVLGGLAGLVLTVFAVKVINGSDATRRAAEESNFPVGFGDWIKNAAHQPSFYLALAGFLLILIGAAIGPSKRTRTV